MPTRRRLTDTAEGCSEGWDVELDGRVVAHLDEPCWEDMFWTSYRITPTVDDPKLAALLLTEELWQAEHHRFTFRSRAHGLVAEHAFPALGGFLEPARVNMRGLSILRPDDRLPVGILGRLWRRLTGPR